MQAEPLPCVSVSSISAALSICLFGPAYLGMSGKLSLVAKSTRCKRCVCSGEM